jgi:hypothetical protein
MSIFRLLEEVRKRPGMFVGGLPRTAPMDALEMLLRGYELALTEHQISEPGSKFLSNFGNYLWTTHGMEQSCGPIRAIRHASATDEEAWTRLWTLLDEFKATLGLNP